MTHPPEGRSEDQDAAGPDSQDADASMTAPRSASYNRMLKSSALLGGASMINVALGVLRTKILAIQLGPEPFGVIGLYTSLVTMIQGVASLGFGQSAVREIAAAAGADDQAGLARTIIAYRRIVLLTGLAGLLLTIALAQPASQLTFKDNGHILDIACLSLVVFFAEVQAGQTALLQGLRRIRDIGALTTLGAIFSTVFSIPILLVLKERGVVPFLICVGAAQLLVSWLYARRVKVEPLKVSWPETWRVGRTMLSLGLSVVITSLSTSASVYAIRLVISDQQGVAAVGLYQAAYTVSGIYVGFVLAAMGGDFYPRLAGLGDDTAKRNQLVNEQARLALLLATPALIAALVFSAPLIRIMYSAAFVGASDILRWQVLGLLGRIVTWPLGFILLARRDSRAYLVSEVVSNLLHVLLVWFGARWFGLAGTGAAFAVLYVAYFGIVYSLTRVRHGFRYDVGARHVLLICLLAVGAAFAMSFVPSLLWRTLGGLALLGVSGAVCLEALALLVPESRPSRLWRAVRDRLPPIAFGLRLARAGYDRWLTGRQGPRPPGP